MFDALRRPAAAPPAVQGWSVVWWGRDDKGEGDRIKSRRLVAVDDSEERRGCTVVSVTLGLRSGTHARSRHHLTHTWTLFENKVQGKSPLMLSDFQGKKNTNRWYSNCSLEFFIPTVPGVTKQ